MGAMSEETIDHLATQADLRAVEESLRRDIRDTERLLRDRDDVKEAALRVEFIAAVQASEDRTHQRFDDIETHLDRQDTYIMKKRFVWPQWRRDTAGFTTAAIVGSLILHFLFGIG